MRRLGQVLLLFAAAVVSLLVVLYAEHATPLTLPAPPGPFAVGRITAVFPQPQRELAAMIWYPAATHSGTPANYMPRRWHAPLRQMQGFVMGKLLTRDPAVVRAHSMENAALSPARRSYPVVLLRSGIGAFASDYTTLAEALASAGYVVVGWDTPYSTGVVVYPDGRIVHRTRDGNPPEDMPEEERERIAEKLVGAWTSDARFVADELQRRTDLFPGRLDLSSLGIVGHSFGGATAAQFCHDDPRCKAGIDLDGRPFGSVANDGVRQPFLFLMSDHSREKDPTSRKIEAQFRTMLAHSPNAKMTIIHGANHFTFSDQMLLKSGVLLSVLRTLHVFGTLDGRQGLTIVTGEVTKFFAASLKQ